MLDQLVEMFRPAARVSFHERAKAQSREVIDVSRHPDDQPTFVQSLMSWGGASAIGVLVAFAIALVGLAIGVVVEVGHWVASALF